MLNQKRPTAFTRKNSAAIPVGSFGSGAMFETYNPGLSRLGEKRQSVLNHKSISIIHSPNSRGQSQLLKYQKNQKGKVKKPNLSSTQYLGKYRRSRDYLNGLMGTDGSVSPSKLAHTKADG